MSGDTTDESHALEYDRNIQASDRTGIETAVDNLLAKKRRRRERQQDLDIEAQVRELLNLAKEALTTDADVASKVLAEVHDALRTDKDLERILDRGDTLLAEGAEIDADHAAQVRAQFRRHTRLRDRSGRDPTPDAEYKTLLHIARALGYYTSVTDMTPYAPITLEQVDEPGMEAVENPLPVGRRRLPKGTTMDPEQAAVEIPHQSCDHILAVALPRSGKDSTLCSIGMGLHEAGYKYISVFDDGRMETPMLAIPSDEPAIRQNLERMGQEPKAFDTEVFVPSTPDLPDPLPANFREFSIGVDKLSPNLVLRIADVRTSDATVEDRIEQALDATLEGSGAVPELVGRLQRLAEEQNVTLQWNEAQDRHRTGASGGTTVETYQTSYEVGSSKALKKAAARIGKLAADGIITSAGAATNIDMEAVIADQETAAVLNSNFLPAGSEELKYTIIDLWLRLIYKARDSNPRLPRVALELRELKNIAPSKPGDTRYKDAIKTLRQTIFFLSTNGGSRRILMLGSTQKLNDVYKPVRTNMATKILLRLGEEEIDTLDRSYNFSWKQKEQLSGFNIGMGMLIAGGEKTYPIEWRGAPCGLGLGDQHWLDRYGRARGARVRQVKGSAWPPSRYRSDEWWVHVPDGDVRPTGEKPVLDDFYSEWHLLESDFPDGTDAGGVGRKLIEDVLADRREYDAPSAIHLLDAFADDPDSVDHDREVSMISVAESNDDTVESIMARWGVPGPVKPLLITDAGKLRRGSVRENCLEVCRVVDANDDLTSQPAIAEHTAISTTSLNNYMGQKSSIPMDEMITKPDAGKAYELTDVGEAALEVDWESVVEEVREL